MEAEESEAEVSGRALQLDRHQRQLDLIRRRRSSLSRRCEELTRAVVYSADVSDPTAVVEAKQNHKIYLEDAPLPPMCILGIIFHLTQHHV